LKNQAPRSPITKEHACFLACKALISQGDALYRAGDYRKALESYSRAMAGEHAKERILIARANRYVALGLPEDALRDLEQASRKTL
jgi:tetratricopeptide (TPR) repeat protein